MSYEMYVNHHAGNVPVRNAANSSATIVKYAEPEELVGYTGSQNGFYQALYYNSSIDDWDYGWIDDNDIERLTVYQGNSGKSVYTKIYDENTFADLGNQTIYYITTNRSLGMYDGSANYISTLPSGTLLGVYGDFNMGQSRNHWISFRYYKDGSLWLSAGEARFVAYTSLTSNTGDPDYYYVNF